MKTKILFILICNLIICNLQYLQNIINTLGSGGIFTIKDGSTNYFTLNQATGQVNIIKSLRLESTSDLGTDAIYFGPNRFIHNYGIQNTFLGTNAGNFTLIAFISGNTGIGSSSLSSLTLGDANTALGCNSLLSNTGGSNNTAIGYSSAVPIGTASNQVQIGNTSITFAGVQVPWTTSSDRRLKSDIQNSGLGLSFISKLRPVSYFRNNDENKKTEFGFIAQEVEEVLKESGNENSGIITITDEGMYELRYNDLLAPMVKAIQELKAENDELKKSNNKLTAEVELLSSIGQKFAKLEQMINELPTVKNASLSENK